MPIARVIYDVLYVCIHVLYLYTFHNRSYSQIVYSMFSLEMVFIFCDLTWYKVILSDARLSSDGS